MNTDMRTEKNHVSMKGRDWDNASRSQGFLPRIDQRLPANHPKLEERPEPESLSQPMEGKNPAPTSPYWTVASSSVR